MPFPITCTACHKTFSIADDVYERKVKGRVVTIKCKQCQAGIRIDGTQETPRASESVPPPPAADAVPTNAVGPEPIATVDPTRATRASIASAPELVAEAARPSVPEPPIAPAPTLAAPEPRMAAAIPKSATLSAFKSGTGPGGASPQTSSAGAKAAPFGGPKAAPGPSTGGKSAALAITANATPLAAGSAKLAANAAATAATKAVGVKGTGPGNTAASTAKFPPFGTSAKLGATPKVPLAAAPAAKFGVAATAPVTPAAAPVTPGPAPAAEAAPLAEVLWAVDYPDGQDRELTLAQIGKELASGAINRTSLVWREGMPEWLELGQVSELAALLEAPKPPPAPAFRAKAASAPGLDRPAPPAELPKPRATAPSAPGLDVASASSTVAAASPPPIPRQPTIAGIGRPPPPAPFAVPAAPTAAAQAPAPFTAQNVSLPRAQEPEFPSLAAFPAAPVMVPAPSLAAPFATPVQPFGRPAAPPVRAMPEAAGIAEWPEKKSRAPWIVIAVLLLIAIGAGVFFATRPDAKSPPSAPISALAAQQTPSPRAPTAEPPPNAPAASEPEHNTAPTRATSRTALDAPGTRPLPANAGFAEQFANAARHANGGTSAAPSAHH